MPTYKDQLLARLVRDGWEQLEAVDLDTWWATDCWRLRSIRQSYGLELFLTFLVDPQWDRAHTGERPPVWAVAATAGRPESFSPANPVALLCMRKRKFVAKLDQFVAALAAYRNAQHQRATKPRKAASPNEPPE